MIVSSNTFSLFSPFSLFLGLQCYKCQIVGIVPQIPTVLFIRFSLFLSVAQIGTSLSFYLPAPFLHCLCSAVECIHRGFFPFGLLCFSVLKFRLLFLYIVSYIADIFYFFAEAVYFFTCFKCVPNAIFIIIASKSSSDNSNIFAILVLSFIIVYLQSV